MDDLEKLHNWVFSIEKPPAQTHFTEGHARNIAKEIELLHHKLNHSTPYYDLHFCHLKPYQITDIKDSNYFDCLFMADLCNVICLVPAKRILIGDKVFAIDRIEKEENDEAKFVRIWFIKMPQYYYDGE